MITPPIRAGEQVAAYGLLRPGGGGLEALRLTRDVRVLGPCRIRGALVDLGAYPGLIHGDGEVRGDLLRIETDRAGVRLDAYEDFDPMSPQTSLYVRRQVRLAAPSGASAWIYEWRGGVTGAERIPSGDWLAHVAAR